MGLKLQQVICDTFDSYISLIRLYLCTPRSHRLRSRLSAPARTHSNDVVLTDARPLAVSSPNENLGLVSRGCVVSKRGGGRTFSRRRNVHGGAARDFLDYDMTLAPNKYEL